MLQTARLLRRPSLDVLGLYFLLRQFTIHMLKLGCINRSFPLVRDRKILVSNASDSSAIEAALSLDVLGLYFLLRQFTIHMLKLGSINRSFPLVRDRKILVCNASDRSAIEAAPLFLNVSGLYFLLRCQVPCTFLLLRCEVAR